MDLVQTAAAKCYAWIPTCRGTHAFFTLLFCHGFVNDKLPAGKVKLNLLPSP